VLTPVHAGKSLLGAFYRGDAETDVVLLKPKRGS
jgi:hypothetical protein